MTGDEERSSSGGQEDRFDSSLRSSLNDRGKRGDEDRSPSERTESRSAADDAVELEPTGEAEAPHDATGLGLASLIAAGARGKQQPRRRPKQRPQQIQYSGARSDARDPQLLGAALERLTEQRGWDEQLSVRAIFSRWAELVGAATAAHSRPVAYDDGVVEVRCDSTAWATQLRLLAPQLVATLNAELGHGTVTRLLIKGPDAPSWKHGRRSVSDGRGPRDTYG